MHFRVRSSLLRLLTRSLVFALLVLCAAPVHAAEPCGTTTGKEVPELVKQGKVYFRAENYECARQFFRHAYSKQESYDIVGNLGIVTHEVAKSNNDPVLFAEAATYLSAAVRGFPAHDDATMKRKLAALKLRITDCASRVVTLVLKDTITPRSACLIIGKIDAGCGPFTHELFAPPGTLVIQAKAPGYPSGEQRIEDAKANTRHSVRFDLTASTVSSGTAPAPGKSGQPNGDQAGGGFPLWPTWVVGGAALVAIGVGAGLFVAGESETSDALKLRDLTANDLGNDNFCVPPVEANAQNACDSIDEGLASGDELKGAGVGLFVVGGVLALGAGALAVTHLLIDDGPSQTGIRMVPSIDLRGGASMMIEGRW